MNNKKFTIIIVALLIAFAIASVAIFLQSYRTITNSIEQSMGQGAADLATLVAGEISLTDAVGTEEGTFVGMAGVDIHQGDYIEQKNSAFRSVIVSFLIVLLLLGVMILFLYHKYTKADRKAKFVDALTLAHNRRYINEILHDQLNGKKFQKSKYLLYMMIDYDLFKNINDTYGHFMGDACLKIMKPSFEKVSKGCPRQISRFGGEEFFAVVGVRNVEQAKAITENLRKNIESSDPMNNGVHISVSIGAFVMTYIKCTQATESTCAE